MPLVRGASRRRGGRRARFMQRLGGTGAIPRTNRRSFSHALVRRKKGVCELGSIGSDPKRRPWQRSKSLVQRFALRLIRRAPPAIGAQSALQTIAIDSQTVCAPFLASAARDNKKTPGPAPEHPANSRAVSPRIAHTPAKKQPRRSEQLHAHHGRRRQAPTTEAPALDDQKKDEGPDRRHEGADGQDAEVVAGPAPVAGSASEEEGQETGISSAGARDGTTRAGHGRCVSSDRTAALRHGAAAAAHTAAADHVVGGAHAVDASPVRERAPTFWRRAAGVSWSAGAGTEEAVAVAFSRKTAAVAVAVSREA